MELRKSKKSKKYFVFSKDQIEKVGNTIIFLCNKIENLSKTKILKLLYLLDETSIKNSGLPFLNLQYKVWKYGPVSEEIFIDLSEDLKILGKFIEYDKSNNNTIIKTKLEFDDSEFTNNDIKYLDYVISNFGNKSAIDLKNITHQINSAWYNVAKNNNVLDLLENETINNTEYVIDMIQLIVHDEQKKAIYLDYIESH